MKRFMLLPLLWLSISAVADSAQVLDIKVRTLAGTESVNLAEAYRDKVVLVVNVASKCGYTRQYEKLEAMYQKYRERGLVVLGFPSNDFLGQEPGSEQGIADFCRKTYGVEFPMFEKVSVKTPETAHPLYRRLAKQAGSYPKWNFHKYLIGKDGRVVAHYKSAVAPDAKQLVEAIETELNK